MTSNLSILNSQKSETTKKTKRPRLNMQPERTQEYGGDVIRDTAGRPPSTYAREVVVVHIAAIKGYLLASMTFSA